MRALITLGLLALTAALAIFVGARFALLMLIGIGLGFVLERFGFGFAGPWRRWIRERNPQGVIAQCWAIALTAVIIQPLIASQDSLVGAIGPISLSMGLAAAVFGLAMQLLLGCGSGTLVNAGSGNLVALVALPAFCVGSFAGSLWVPAAVAAIPHIAVDLTTEFGVAGSLATTLSCLAVIAVLAHWKGSTSGLNRRLMLAATLVAVLAIAHVLVAGQPWGVVYGLGLWVAKIAVPLGWDPTGSAFWSASVNATSLSNSVLNDVTSLTSIGLMAGAALASWQSVKGQPLLPSIRWQLYGVVLLAGLVLGISSRLAFGCNVGALFSGIASGSLHGWVWMVCGFGGSLIGVRLRDRLWSL
ncbi:YeeE/YedE thiosulfate transporter family protein [Litorivicinus lipolyticus]|nr:YeeE/YedE thiosulfate transporter family protein [Litorivicinus lipolyticus]